MPTKVKGGFYKTNTRPVMLYESEKSDATVQHIHKMSVAEMKMLKCMCINTRLDKIKIVHICRKVQVAHIEKSRLKWFCHVLHRPPDAPVSLGAKPWWMKALKVMGRPRG